MHDLTVITNLAAALAIALVFGWATRKLGLSTLVGYLLAGIAVGPYTPGFVADVRIAFQMAEIGVILLMFGVGLHFHPEELLRVWRIAVPGAIGQSAVAAVAGWAAARAFGWSHGAGIVFGMALAVASTVVLMRMLVQEDRLSSRDGHVAVGWLIIEDLFTVLALVLLPALVVAHKDPLATAGALGLAVVKAGAFAAVVWLVGTRFVAPVMERISRTRSTELFTLTIFVVALGVAIVAAEVFSVSVALGAFFAGLVVGQSRFGAQAAADMAPFRDVFSALFFVSIGMLFNPALVTLRPLLVLTVLAIVLLLKPLTALAIVTVMRDTRRTALTVAVGLAQIGEFSFILGALGVALGVLPQEAMEALVAVAIVSIALNPLLFRAVAVTESRATEDVTAELKPVESGEGATGREPAFSVVTAGTGELAQRLVRRCADHGIPVCVVDNDPAGLEALSSYGVATLHGDPGSEDVLRTAGVGEARLIVVTDASLAGKMQTCIAARKINPRIAIIATSGSDAERAWLKEFGAAYVCDALDEMTEALFRSIRSGL
jgi:monovalent cation:H+ antiporter-2, CPA2 family